MPNFLLLQRALHQYGPWASERLTIDTDWLNTALQSRIHSISWSDAAEDVAPFLPPAEQHSLKLWSARFFNGKLGKLIDDLTRSNSHHESK